MVLNNYYFIVWYVYSALRYFNEFSGTTVGLINRDDGITIVVFARMYLAFG